MTTAAIGHYFDQINNKTKQIFVYKQ